MQFRGGLNRMRNNDIALAVVACVFIIMASIIIICWIELKSPCKTPAQREYAQYSDCVESATANRKYDRLQNCILLKPKEIP